MPVAQSGGSMAGGEPPSFLPVCLDLKDNTAAEYVRKHCEVEIIEPGRGDFGRIADYIRFRYKSHPDADSSTFVSSISGEMIVRMAKIPQRFALLRYVGGDLSFQGAGSVLKQGGVVGVNTSKQTFVYPEEWFKGILSASARHTMDELSTAVTSEKSPFRFRTFHEIENLVEGGIRKGSGAGFLMLALVDERLRGLRLSQKLLSGVLGYYRDVVGVPYVFVYGRVPEICRDEAVYEEFKAGGRLSPVSLNRYLKQVLAEERRDWGVSLHHQAGARMICGLPNSVQDAESLNSGYLGIYDLGELRAQGRI